MNQKSATAANQKTIDQKNVHPVLDAESLKEADARLRNRYLFGWLLLALGLLYVIISKDDKIFPVVAIMGAGYLIVSLTAVDRYKLHTRREREIGEADREDILDEPAFYYSVRELELKRKYE